MQMPTDLDGRKNVFNDWTLEYYGPAIYGVNYGRYLNGSLTLDL